MRRRILISEVGPRDGLQSLAEPIPLQVKKAWIDAEAGAGVREIEVGSFVNYQAFPQMADTAELVAHARKIPGLTVAVLVPNLRGAVAAIASGAHKISLPLSASETHSRRNVNRGHDQMIEEIRAIRAAVDEVAVEVRPRFEVGLATAFGCSIEGAVPLDGLRRLAVRATEAGAAEIGLSDTAGYATPLAIGTRLRAVRAEIGTERLTGVHLHNTRGLGLANALAALDEGIDTLDASLAGLGGCPAAPGASGNVVTEDLAFMLEAMGYDTGINLDRLMRVRDILRIALPDEPLYGFLPDAGLPKGWPKLQRAA